MEGRAHRDHHQFDQSHDGRRGQHPPAMSELPGGTEGGLGRVALPPSLPPCLDLGEGEGGGEERGGDG